MNQPRWTETLRPELRRVGVGMGVVALVLAWALVMRPEAWLPALSVALVLVASAGVWLSFRRLEEERRRVIERDAEIAGLRALVDTHRTNVEHLERVASDAGAAVAGAIEGIARFDVHGAHRWVNDSYARLLDFSPSDLVGVRFAEVISPDHPKSEKCKQRLLDEGSLESEIPLLTRTGLQVPVRAHFLKCEDREGNFDGFYCHVFDLSEWKEIEAALDLKDREIDRVNHELEQFAYVAAHDLQEPARKILAFGSLLEKDLGDDLPEKAARDLEFISDAARRLRHLVQDLLLLSRAGRAAMRQEPIDLGSCADVALEALAIRVEETQVEITRDPLPVVRGDRTLLTQLMQNLISNALKFSDAEEPKVRITAERNGSEWVIGVLDNGIGIEEEYAEQIFQPFKRLHGREEYEGTGIGLAICRRAVERHGGKIWVESVLGEGAHFRFTLAVDDE